MKSSRLPVAVFNARDRARREEAVAQEALARSTPPLSVGRLGLHSRGWTRSAAGDLEQPRVVAHGVAVAREHDVFGGYRRAIAS